VSRAFVPRGETDREEVSEAEGFILF